MIDPAAAYRALRARDARFDGLFFVGVASTGIYCRPVCPARTPQARNCRFFASAALAESEGFRPCLRCRPELAPGSAPVDRAQRVAHLLVQRIEEGGIAEGVGLEQVAEDFGLSSRQLRRIVHDELGVSPVQLVLTRRLLLAKHLLTETALPVTEIAFACGFSSLRRFNDAFRRRYRLPPTGVRREAGRSAQALPDAPSSTVALGYRPPYDWDQVLAFLDARRMKDVELIRDGAYLRTVRLRDLAGWIRVTHAPARRALQVEFSHSLTLALPALLGRLRHQFDLAARPDAIAALLGADPRLADGVRGRPGLRVPGAFEGFEMAVRAILGQQITVKAATTLAGRFAEAFGAPAVTPWPELSRLSPVAARVARASVDEIARLGIVGARARTLLALARDFASGHLRLEPGADPERVMAQLAAYPGIGAWTAHYLAMRGLRWPDAFPKEDIAVRRRLGDVSAAQAEALSQAWRPWRSYAVLHLWQLPAKHPPGSAG